MARILIPLVGLVGITGLVTISTHADDGTQSPQTVSHWSQFRGPNCSGIAGEQAAPVNFDPENNLLWKTPLSSGASSPSVWGERIYLTGFDRDANQLEVICVNRDDGSVIWRRNVGAQQIERVHGSSSPASGTVTTDGERVYAYFGSRGLLCYDTEGELVWSIDLPVPDTRNGSGTSPVVVGDIVLLNRDQRNEPCLLAVNKRTGEEVWRHEHFFAPGLLVEGYATPVLWNDLVLLHTHEGIRAHELETGDLVWQLNTRSTGCSTPVIHNDHLIVATWLNLGEPALRQEFPKFKQLLEADKDQSGTISFEEFPNKYLLFDRPEAHDENGIKLPLRFILGMIDSDGDQELTQEEWESGVARFSNFITDHGLLSIKLGGAGEVTEDSVRIIHKKDIPEVPSPLVVDGRIYIVKNGGILTCFDASSGKQLFRKRIRATGSYFASPIAVGDKIYLSSAQGVITVIRASDKLEVLAENKLAERTLATPAVVDDVIYVRTDKHLYAFAE